MNSPAPSLDQLIDQAVALHNAGQFPEAESLYIRALEQQPDDPDLLHLIGLLALQTNRFELAARRLQRAVALQPGIAVFHNHFGTALLRLGQLDQAIASFRNTIRLNPTLHLAYINLANALKAQNQLDEAARALKSAIASHPDDPLAHNNLADVLSLQLHFPEALAESEKALALNANFPEAHLNRGNALRRLARSIEALAEYDKAISLSPDLSEAHHARSVLLREQGDLDQALAACDKSLALRPDWADAHLTRAYILLQRGDFRQGWLEHEWRWKTDSFRPIANRFPQPRWDGQSLPAGHTLLIHAEQGFGDAIQFLRFISLATRRVQPGQLILELPPALHRLAQSLDTPLPIQILARGQALPTFHIQCPLLSLPLALQLTEPFLTDSVPYLRADADRMARWRQQIHQDVKLKIGLIWSGNPDHPHLAHKSAYLNEFVRLLSLSDCVFYSLQKGDPSRQVSHLPQGATIADLASGLSDFADTAALLANLDLLITVDTAAAHLAGAMGRRVWMLLPAAADWRWMTGRSDSPWYPTMRLFRQPSPGQWQPVIQQLQHELQSLLNASDQLAK